MDIIEQNDIHSKRHPWELARLEIVFKLLQRHIAPQDKIQILDIGSGDGFVAASILKKWNNIHITSIDTAYKTEEIALKEKNICNPKFKLFNSFSDAEAYLGNQHVHIVLLLDVIEHIPNDDQFLSDMMTSSCLQDGTKIFITVPAFQKLFSAHDTFLKHYRRYDLKTLKQTVAKAGLCTLHSGYFFSALLPVRFLQKLGEKIGLLNNQHGIGLWKQPDSLTIIIKRFLMLDYWMSNKLGRAGITIPGLSVFCICEKSI